MNLITNWDPIISILVFIVSSILALFLYYRTGRHELVDDEILFDSSIIGLIFTCDKRLSDVIIVRILL